MILLTLDMFKAAVARTVAFCVNSLLLHVGFLHILRVGCLNRMTEHAPAEDIEAEDKNPSSENEEDRSLSSTGFC